jgi:cell division protease FtsH
MAGGYTMYRPTEDKSFMSKTEMEENIVSLLGGRVAEALILNDISTGASNDIERASQIARNMVTKYGMSEKVGTVMFGGGEGEVFLGRDFAQTKDYSEETAALIDEEVKRIVQTAYEKAVKIFIFTAFYIIWQEQRNTMSLYSLFYNTIKIIKFKSLISKIRNYSR